jgi:GDP-4-dehydro-6-deoxy-D-mannose reductase
LVLFFKKEHFLLSKTGPILVTGANGFVGRHLTAALSENTIVAPSLDVRDAAAVASVIRDSAPACCIHLAAISSVARADVAEGVAWQTNLHGALNVARAILADAPSCQLLFASSADAYGASFAGGAPVTETTPLAPMTLYGATKAAADLALGSLAVRGLQVVRLRLFNHVGAGQSPDFVAASFARQLALIGAGKQAPVMQVGRLDSWRDFLDVRDVCAAYAACIARRDSLPAGTILNIASGQPRRIGDVLDDMIKLSGLTVDVRVQAARVRSFDITRASGDAARAAALLGWTPRISWPETLRTVLDDWRGRASAPDISV